MNEKEQIVELTKVCYGLLDILQRLQDDGFRHNSIRPLGEKLDAIYMAQREEEANA